MEDYQQQKTQNETAFKEILQLARPDIYQLLLALDETNVNWWVILKVIRQLFLLSAENKGSGYGTVSIQVEKNQVIFVRGEESNRLNEPLIKPFEEKT